MGHWTFTPAIGATERKAEAKLERMWGVMEEEDTGASAQGDNSTQGILSMRVGFKSMEKKEWALRNVQAGGRHKGRPISSSLCASPHLVHRNRNRKPIA